MVSGVALAKVLMLSYPSPNKEGNKKINTAKMEAPYKALL